MRFNNEIHVLNLMQVLDSKLWFHNWETKIECLEIFNWRKRYQLGERLREFEIGLNGVMSCWMSSNVRNYEKTLWPKNLIEAMQGFAQMLCRRRIHIFELIFRALELMESTPSNDVNSAERNALISYSWSSVKLVPRHIIWPTTATLYHIGYMI